MGRNDKPQATVQKGWSHCVRQTKTNERTLQERFSTCLLVANNTYVYKNSVHVCTLNIVDSVQQKTRRNGVQLAANYCKVTTSQA
jgi:hypothetical protein